MFLKLTDEQQEELLENAIIEFGENGLSGAKISDVAKRTGISVGVIYKYHENKNDLFNVCLSRSLDILKKVLNDAVAGDESLLGSVEHLIRASQRFAKEHPSYFCMYHTITSSSDSQGAGQYAEEIERITSEVYSGLILKARQNGTLTGSFDVKSFAFFFDNLIMMLHFSYACDYYRHRMEIYCGGQDDERDERIVQQLLLFIRNAFGIVE